MLEPAENKVPPEETLTKKYLSVDELAHSKSEDHSNVINTITCNERESTRQRAYSQEIPIDSKRQQSTLKQAHDQQFFSDPKNIDKKYSSSTRKALSSPGVCNTARRCANENQQFGQGDRVNVLSQILDVHDEHMQSDDLCSCCAQKNFPIHDIEQKRPRTDSSQRHCQQKNETDCHKSNLATNARESCPHHHVHDQQSYTKNDCSFDEHSDSGASSFSDDGKTYQSEYSRHTCFCSKNQSHEDLSLVSDIDEVPIQSGKVERFRGGVDTVNAQATIINSQTSNMMCRGLSTYQHHIVNQVKFSKLGELCEDLERLKLRNRNLKDFLHTLEDPMALIGKASEATSACTEVSSCVTIDSARPSHNSLLTVVKVLESKCRDKDAVIGALAEELTTSRRKSLGDGSRVRKLNF
ncbi:hypothetical protein QAD02_009641 [Eretmocerus hayati]|uniref:Uncharacterized protein n=1 Tax=Eretmocerus hayati TaxID=131215 RepID=A0ACC2NAL8_9HYME|nr:hypothetical protein QAD02_009641 [Eretmocerus hayati]